MCDLLLHLIASSHGRGGVQGKMKENVCNDFFSSLCLFDLKNFQIENNASELDVDILR